LYIDSVKICSKIADVSVSDLENIIKNHYQYVNIQIGKTEKKNCYQSNQNTKMCIDIDLHTTIDGQPEIKIFGSAQKLIHGTNAENHEIKYNEFREAIEDDCHFHLNWEQTYFSRLDLGINHKKNNDVRFLIKKIKNNSQMKSRTYNDQTFMISNTQRTFRIYDKIQEQIDKKELGTFTYKNKHGHVITKKDIKKAELIPHDILREELATWKKANIQNYFTRPEAIFDLENTNKFFKYWKKRLQVPNDYIEKEHLDDFNLQKYFITNGFEKTIEHTIRKNIFDEIEYKKWVELFKTSEIPDRTRYRYQKKIRDLLMS